ncbi:MAG: GDSL-type esterase/lipase family protein [Clostridia bacterium]|nr:GDSL-type esterase/lipase family protein [Clostridia bacterium]
MKLTSDDVVLFTGDSITEGKRERRMDCNHVFGHGYQYTVASTLALENCAAGPKFINKAYSGYTITRLLETWQEDVCANKPTLVSILVGINDVSMGFYDGISVEDTVDKYERDFITAVEMTKKASPDVRFVILEPFYFPLERNGSYALTPYSEVEPPFNRPDNGDTDEIVNYRLEAIPLIAEKVKKIAEDYGFTFVPLREKFLENMKISRPEYFIWDGVHPTMTGHALIAEEWLKATADL